MLHSLKEWVCVIFSHSHRKSLFLIQHFLLLIQHLLLLINSMSHELGMIYKPSNMINKHTVTIINKKRPLPIADLGGCYHDYKQENYSLII